MSVQIISSVYKIKLVKKKTPWDKKKINELYRLYGIQKQMFRKLMKQIRNMMDTENDMDILNNSMKKLQNEMSLIKMSQFPVFNITRSLRLKRKKRVGIRRS